MPDRRRLNSSSRHPVRDRLFTKISLKLVALFAIRSRQYSEILGDSVVLEFLHLIGHVRQTVREGPSNPPTKSKPAGSRWRPFFSIPIGLDQPKLLRCQRPVDRTLGLCDRLSSCRRLALNSCPAKGSRPSPSCRPSPWTTVNSTSRCFIGSLKKNGPRAGGGPGA
jgi:hypothetical protein